MTNNSKDNSQIENWRGGLGDAYTDRNTLAPDLLAARREMWGRILQHAPLPPEPKLLEIGANVGANLRALKELVDADFFALEPNAKARSCLTEDGVLPTANIFDALAQDIPLPDASVDLAFTSGVLIHINPDDLLACCAEIYRVSRRYVVSVEYFSKEPEEKTYQGKEGLLFKRDFGSFWLDNFPDLSCRGYGFEWKPATGLDDLTWWVLEKQTNL